MAYTIVEKKQGEKLLAEEWNAMQTNASDALRALEDRLAAVQAQLAVQQAELDAGLVPVRCAGFVEAAGAVGGSYQSLPVGQDPFTVNLVASPVLTLSLAEDSVVELSALVDIQPGEQSHVQFVVGSGGLKAPARVVAYSVANTTGLSTYQTQNFTFQGVKYLFGAAGPKLSTWPKWLQYHDAYYKTYSLWPLCGTQVVGGAYTRQLAELVELPAGEHTVQLAFIAGPTRTGSATAYRDLILRALVWPF